MDDAVAEMIAIAVAVVMAAVVSISGFNVAKGTAAHSGRVGELTSSEWALIETPALCTDAGGDWDPPPLGQPNTPGTCSAGE